EALSADGVAVASAAPVAAATAMDKLVQALPEQKPVADTGNRFDMHQDGRTMGADEFDAWMRARQIRVATGKPTPVAANAAPAPAVVAPVAVAAAPVTTAAASSPAAAGITLQVASFSNQR